MCVIILKQWFKTLTQKYLNMKNKKFDSIELIEQELGVREKMIYTICDPEDELSFDSEDELSFDSEDELSFESEGELSFDFDN